MIDLKGLSSDIIEAIELNKKKGKPPNRLIFEKSPYLLQHAFNPVNWYPWSDETLEKVKNENKLIFLSIGYSTCYWCHVMEREIFEKKEFATFLNNHFISIKVDREERPDLDRIYMKALIAMTGEGGWPMSLFLTPDLKPFFAASYLPPVSKFGRPAFPDILRKIIELWATTPEKLVDTGNKITTYLQKEFSRKDNNADADVIVKKEFFDNAFHYFKESYDSQFGGFGSGIKFPGTANYNFLLNYFSNTGNHDALKITLQSLKKIASGGIHDHIGGGFHRYSVDREWRVPHFEKMLYDQAQLASIYLDAYLITKDEAYGEVSKGIFNYVVSELTGKEGGFFSAEDAESAIDKNQPDKKEEGRFYLWKWDEIIEVTGEEKGEIFNYYFGVRKKGNALSDPHNLFQDSNILFEAHGLEETGLHFKKESEEIRRILEECKSKLKVYRTTRPRPGLDDKIIVSWNGLMISAFARGFQILNKPEYLIAAKKNAEFIKMKLYNSKEKKLYRRYRDGEAKYPAHLEDYSFLIQGIIDLYEVSGKTEWLEFAVELTELQNELFFDAEFGGFFETSGEDKSLIFQIKDNFDNATPTGNSVALLNLLRLSNMLNNSKWRQIINKSFAYFNKDFTQTPYAMPSMLSALFFNVNKPMQIIISGINGREDTGELFMELFSHYLPIKVILFSDNVERKNFISSHIPFLEDLVMKEGRATAYVCENFKCDYPATDREALKKILLKILSHNKLI